MELDIMYTTVVLKQFKALFDTMEYNCTYCNTIKLYLKITGVFETYM